MKKLSLIGAGFIGSVHAQNLAFHPNVQFTHVYDVDKKRAEALAAKYGVQCAELNEIMKSDIDGLLIASSTNSHADITKLAVMHDKAIFCEKPIDLDLQRVRKTCSLVKKSGLPNMVDFNRRFDPSHQALRTSIARKELGVLELLHISARDQAPPPVEYVKVSGGQLRDQTIHFFDLLCFLTADRPVEVSVMGAALVTKEIGKLGDVDSTIINLRMSSGTLVQIDCSRRSPCGYDERIEVMGSEAMAESERQPYRHLVVHKGKHRRADGLHSSWYERMQGTYYRSLDRFVLLLQKQKSDIAVPSFDDGLVAQIIADTATKALSSGKKERIQYSMPKGA